MKLTTALILATCMQVYASGSDAQTVTISKKNMSLQQVFKQINRQTGLDFVYNMQLLKSAKKIDLDVKNATISEVLKACFAEQPFIFETIGGTIIVSPKPVVIEKVETTVPLIVTKKIIGKVTNENGEALSGATIQAKGAKVIVQTKDDGSFTIDVPESVTTLIISFVGMETEEINITNKTNLSVALKSEQKKIDEIVVTALGVTRSKKALGYSVTEVSGDQFVQNRTPNLATQLAGKVAGVSVSTSSTGLNGSQRVVIRGNDGIGAGSQPLYVVDGIPINVGQQAVPGTFSGIDFGNSLSSINPDDIETMSVLKGNAAAALYGSRASDGVILITTKSGKGKKGVSVEFNSNNTWESAIDFQDNIQKEYGLGLDGLRPTTAAQALSWGFQSWGQKLDGAPNIMFDGVERPYSYRRNPFDIYNTGFSSYNTVSVGVNGENSNLRFSLGSGSATSVVPNSSFNRKNISLNYTAKLLNFLTLNISSKYSNEINENRPGTGDFAYSGLTAGIPTTLSLDLIRGNPNKIGTDNSGRELRYHTDDFWKNPFYAFYQEKNKQTIDRFINSLQARIDITKWLYLRGSFGMDILSGQIGISQPIQRYENPALGGGFASESQSRARETNLEALIGFNKNVNKFNFNGFVGANRMRNSNQSITREGTNTTIPDFYSVNFMSTQRSSNFFAQSGINSVYYSAEISYDNYAFITATGRKDWFSTLNGIGIFYPSVSGSFVFTDFFRKKGIAIPTNIMEFGKLRLSWAQVGGGAGNSTETNLAYNTLIGLHNGAAVGSISQSAVPVTNLQPYLNTEVEIGTDLRFFKNRVRLDLNYYSRKITNEIIPVTYSIASGFASSLINVGQTTNKGVEISLTVVPVKTKNFTWETTINYAKNNNKLVQLDGSLKEVFVSASRAGRSNVVHAVGFPLGMLTATNQLTDASGRRVYDGTDRPIPGNTAFPYKPGVHDKLASLSNSISFKGFQLNALIEGQFGGWILSGSDVLLIQRGLSTQSLPGRDPANPLIINGVTSTGVEIKNKAVPLANVDNYYGRWSTVDGNTIYDASFVKLREFSVSYDLSRVVKVKSIKGIAVSVVGRNLLTLYKKTLNIDPEASMNNVASGIEWAGLPATRTIGFNLNIKF